MREMDEWCTKFCFYVFLPSIATNWFSVSEHSANINAEAMQAERER